VTMSADGSFTYKPATLPATGSATVTFTYVAKDVPALPLNPGPALATAPSVVTLTLLPNVAPVTVNDVFAKTYSFPSTASAINVLSNDTDADGTLDPASVRLRPSAGVFVAPNGLSALTIRGSIVTVNTTTGAINYTPGPLFKGVETIQYRVNDNFGAVSNTAMLRITVQ
jgi:large repetitive protein